MWQELHSNGPFERTFDQIRKFYWNSKLSSRTNIHANAFIFDSEKSSKCILWDGKVLLPQLKVFYPLFTLMHYNHKNENFDLIIRYSPSSGGIQNFWRGKNFSFFDRVDFDIFTRRKNQLNRLKIYHFMFKRTWVEDLIFWNQNGSYPSKHPQILKAVMG